jgi:ribosome biogenesis GTPase
LNRGKHTTRVVEIIHWENGYLIDSPGFSSFEFNFDKLSLANAFEIFRNNKSSCKFNNCLHYKELDCEIKRMVAKLEISNLIYNDYIDMQKELSNEE